MEILFARLLKKHLRSRSIIEHILMNIILEINNKTKFKFSKKKFEAIFKKTIELVADEDVSKKILELSIAFVDEDEIHLLNRQYRKKDSSTDVLSFAEFEKIQELKESDLPKDSEGLFIGELIICPSYVQKNATEDGESFEFAMAYITSHGILHLLGFSHGKKMFDLQRNVAEMLAK